MECNREEAVRAKEIAERYFLDKDIKRARKFALKAQNLFPALDGISQLVKTFEVYISSEEKINGEYNWYAVLGVPPLADDKTVRKQYRKLALILHPDKNKSVGAEGAFKLVSQAWSLLSDKAKKFEYDQMYSRACYQMNGFYNFSKNATSGTKGPKGNSSKKDVSSGPPPPRKKEQRTFWTVCHRCKMQYEYLRMYLNQHLLCPNCLEAYFATEIEPPSKGFNISNSSNSAPFFDSNGSAQAANMVQQAYEKVRKERQKRQAASRREEANRRKNNSLKRTTDGGSFGHSNAMKRRKGVEDCSSNENTTNELSLEVDFQPMLIEKVRGQIRQKLKHGISTPPPKTSSAFEAHVYNIENETAYDVPDSDFHDFDRNRMASCFKQNQVWAVYDVDGGMPRYYAMIHNVISLSPFEVRISWLNPKFSKWFNSGFSKTCGIFGITKHGIRISIDSFSHKVKWTKGTDGTIQILPLKGDVWALYRNWSTQWNELTEDTIIHKYDTVEVLENYDEELGVLVVPLVKVAGYKAIFHKVLSPREIKLIPREEMGRFSHQVPSRYLTGREGSDGLKGCLELDPAATPSELLEVISVIKETDLTNDDEISEILDLTDTQTTNVNKGKENS